MKKFILLLSFIVLFSIFSPVGMASVTSDSMDPTLQQDELFLYYDSSLSQSSVGDIIIFEGDHVESSYQDQYTHRIIDITEQGYITRGDNNPVSDQKMGSEPIVESEVHYKVLDINNDPITISIGYDFFNLIVENSIYIAIFFIFVALLDYYNTRRNKTTYKENRNIIQSKKLFLSMFIVIFSLVFIFMYIGATQTVQVVVTEHGNSQTLEVSSENTIEIVKDPANIPILGKKSFYDIDEGDITKIEENKIFISYHPTELGNKEITVKKYSYPKLLSERVLKFLYEKDRLIISSVLALMTSLPSLLLAIIAQKKDFIQLNRLFISGVL